MEPSAREEVCLDIHQVKKAVQALQAYLKSTSKNLLLNESQQLCLLLTFWKVPKKAQTIRIPLPHGLHTESTEVCLFTRDEPNMTAEQTERFYKNLLAKNGMKDIPEVIPFKVLKTEYKSFEAKRRLLGNYNIFLADACIRPRLPSHIGKHFYERKKDPLSVDLRSKHVARDLERLIQGTTLHVTNKGSCCMARVAHTEMTADEIVENIVEAVNTISSKLHLKGRNIKVIHLKSNTSVALPIYTADLGLLTMLEEELKKAKLASETQNKNKMKKKGTDLKRKTADSEKKPGINTEAEGDEEKPGINTEAEGDEEKPGINTEAEGDEEIPQLVPIKSPIKKLKVETPFKTGPKKAPRPATGKRNLKPKQGQEKMGNNTKRSKHRN